MTIGAPHSRHTSSVGRSGTLSRRIGFENLHSGYLAHAMNGPNRPLRTTSGPPQLGQRSSCSVERSCTAWISRSTSTAARALENGPQKSSSTRSEEHTSELQSQSNLVCRLLLE